MAEVGRLLLDTHLWLWWLLGDTRLANAPCRGVVEEAEELALSKTPVHRCRQDRDRSPPLERRVPREVVGRDQFD